MTGIIVFLFIGTQFLMAFFYPIALIYAALLTGAVPLTLGPDEMLTGPFGRFDLPAIRLFGLCVAIIWVILFNLGAAWKYIITYRIHALFLAYCTLALIWSPSLIYGLRMFAKLSAPFLFLLLVMTFVSSMRQLKTIERIVLLSGPLVVIIAVATKMAGLNPNPMLTLPATSPAVFSAHLVVVSVLVLAGLKTGIRARNSLLLVLLVGAVFAAFTRITIGAMFIAFSVILFLAMSGVARLALPMAGLLGLPALFLLSERFRERMFYGSGNLSAIEVVGDPAYALEHLHGSGRFSAWGQFLKLFFDPSPIIGSGLGATQHYFYTHAVTGLGVMHSEYVRLLCEVGVVGLGLFGLTACAYFVRLISTYRSSGNADTGKFTLAAIGGLVVYLIFIATDNGFDYVGQFGIYVFAFIGMSEKARELEERERAATWSVQDSKKSEPMPLQGKRTEKSREYPLVSG